MSAREIGVLKAELERLRNSANLAAVVEETDKLIEALVEAREQVLTGEPHQTNVLLATLQKPVTTAFENITDALRPADRCQKLFGRLLEKAMPPQRLPTEHDVVGQQVPLINRAIAIHLLREGQFEVARIFLGESRAPTGMEGLWKTTDDDRATAAEIPDVGRAGPVSGGGGTDPAAPPQKDEDGGTEAPHAAAVPAQSDADGDHRMANYGPEALPPWDTVSPLLGGQLRESFTEMYRILSCIRRRDLLPAIEWAAQNRDQLDARGSTLRFELIKLQFLHIFVQGIGELDGCDAKDDPSTGGRENYRNGSGNGHAGNGSSRSRSSSGTSSSSRNSRSSGIMRSSNGHANTDASPVASRRPATMTATAACEKALCWARAHFPSFSARYAREVQKLAATAAYAGNMSRSPYRQMFAAAGMRTAFEDAATSFMRDFCALLGLPSESPLHVAATAGAIALPQLIKYTSRVRGQRPGWSTEAEMAFETPLPAHMFYHPVFVCPVSKEQTTDSNPPVMLPCGHVLAQASFLPLVKGLKVKCPYCPLEGFRSEAITISIL